LRERYSDRLKTKIIRKNKIIEKIQTLLKKFGECFEKMFSYHDFLEEITMKVDSAGDLSVLDKEINQFKEVEKFYEETQKIYSCLKDEIKKFVQLITVGEENTNVEKIK